MIIGLTGGIGCGKSEASKAFTNQGFKSIDNDVIVHDLLRDDAEVKFLLKERWGEHILSEEGVHRSEIAKIVFSDESELEWLEKLLHPKVLLSWKEQTRANSQTDWCIEIPLLFEKRLENHFDFTVCITCSFAKQLSRLATRGLSYDQGMARISRQMPLTKKMEFADFVLTNDGSKEFLHKQIDNLVKASRNLS